MLKEPASFWKSLESPLLHHAHTSRCLFPSLLHQSLYRPPVSPYHAASSRSWKSQHELLEFVLILGSAARGSLPTSSAVWHWEESTEDWPQNKGSIYLNLFSQSAWFLWGFQIRGHQGNAAARSWLIGCIIYNITDTHRGFSFYIPNRDWWQACCGHKLGQWHYIRITAVTVQPCQATWSDLETLMSTEGRRL